jgi:signal transduction histidine kinase
LIVLALVPLLCAVVLGVAAIVILVHRARVPGLFGGDALIALWVLFGVLVVVVASAILMARSVADSTDAATAAAQQAHTGLAQAPAPLRPVPAPGVPGSSTHGGPPDSLEAVAAAVREPAVPGGEDVFVHLSRRLQSLVHRQIELLDRLENDVEEPDLLKGLFNVDHLATRVRRHAENLAVLGGAVPRRQWTKPVSVMEVLRSAVSETLDYARVQVIPRASGSINGYAVADVIHLLAELVENATTFSPPDTKVIVRASPVAAGLAIEIDDRGLGMRREEYERLNGLLREPGAISVRELLEGGRIGLYVVARLALRHNIAIQLEPNITGGIQALVVLPQPLLATVEQRQLTSGQDKRGPSAKPAPARPANPPKPETPKANDLWPGSAPTSSIDFPEVDVMVPEQRPAAPEETGGRPMPNGLPARVPGASGHWSQGGEQWPQRPAAQNPPSRTQPAPSTGGDARPPLPRRRPQEHLAAPLLDGTSSQPTLSPESAVGDAPTPSLMADFRRGLTEGASAPDETLAASDYVRSQHVPTQENDT